MIQVTTQKEFMELVKKKIEKGSIVFFDEAGPNLRTGMSASGLGVAQYLQGGFCKIEGICSICGMKLQGKKTICDLHDEERMGNKRIKRAKSNKTSKMRPDVGKRQPACPVGF